MDKNNEKDDQMNEDPKFEDNSSDEDIPLWLQGFYDKDSDKPEPIEAEEDIEDSWVPEISEEISDDDLTSDEDEAIDSPLGTTSTSDYEQMIDEEESLESEPADKIDIDKLPDGNSAEDIGPSLDDSPTTEGFMDISDMDTTEFSRKEESILEEEPLIEGDLPEWLQEMIAEKEKPETGDEDEIPEKQAQDEALIDNELVSVEDEAVEEDLLGDLYMPEEESGFVTDYGQPTDEENDLDNDWLTEKEEPVPDEKISSEEGFYFTESPSNEESKTALEMAQEETKPVIVSYEEEGDLTAEVEEPFDEEPLIDEEEEESLYPTSEEPTFEERLAIEEEEDNTAEVKEPFADEPLFGEEIEDRLYPVFEESYTEEPLAIEEEEDITADDEEPFSDEPLFEEEEDSLYPALDEPSFEGLHAIEEEDDLISSDEEPSGEAPETEDEEEAFPPTFEEPFIEETYATDEEEEILPTIETPIVEGTHLIDDDSVLDELKHNITQGNFDEAFPTIKNYIEDSSHLEKLELWLREASESNAETNSEVWEALGDITLKQNKPEEAFDAYAKAIKNLLIGNEASDETR